MNFSYIDISNIKSADYCCIVKGISKSEAIKLLQNIDLAEKKWSIIKNKYQKQFCSRKFTSNSNLNQKKIWKIKN